MSALALIFGCLTPTSVHASTALSDLLSIQDTDSRVSTTYTPQLEVAPLTETEVFVHQSSTGRPPILVSPAPVHTEASLVQLETPAANDPIVGEFETELSQVQASGRTLQAPLKTSLNQTNTWGWVFKEGSSSALGINLDGTQGGWPDVLSLATDNQTNRPLMGVIKTWFGENRAIGIEELNPTGFLGYYINRIEGPVSQLVAAQYESPNISDGTYALINDRLGLVYFNYDLDNTALRPTVSINSGLTSKDVQNNTASVLKQIENKLLTSPELVQSVKDWSQAHPAEAMGTSVAGLLESGAVSHPTLLAQLRASNADVRIINPEGEMAPSIYGEEPVPQATWGHRPLALQMTALSTQVALPNEANFVITTLSRNNMQTAFIATNTKVVRDEQGYSHAVIGAGNLLHTFDQDSQVLLAKSSSAGFKVAQPIIEKKADGTNVLWMSRFGMTDTGETTRPFLWKLLETTDNISDVSVTALGEQNYIVSKVVNGQLTIDYVYERSESPIVHTIASVPELQVSQTNISQENGRVVVSLTAADNTLVYAASAPLLLEQ